jgi:hypothetical protein
VENRTPRKATASRYFATLLNTLNNYSISYPFPAVAVLGKNIILVVEYRMLNKEFRTAEVFKE